MLYFDHVLCCIQLTDSSQETGHGGVLLVTNNLVLTEETAASALHSTELGVTLALKLPQAEGELVELGLDVVHQLLGRRALGDTALVGETVQGRPVLELLDLAGAQTDTDLNTPDLAQLRDTIAAGTLARGKDDLLLVLDLVATKQPRSGALNQVAVVALDNLLQEGGDSGLGRGLLLGSLGLLLVGAGGQGSGREHHAQEKLVRVVCCEDEIGLASRDNLGLLALLLGEDGSTDNCSETIYLSTQLDLDGLASLNGNVGLGLIGRERSVGRDKSGRRDSRRVGKTWRKHVSWRTT